MNLGSKFNKVKQQASLFLRGDKTDVVGALRDAEDKSDEMRVLSEALSRSLEKRLHTHNVNDEKKLNKIPENQVAELLREGLKETISYQPTDQSEKSLFRNVIEEGVTVEKLLGNLRLDYEERVTREVLPFLHQLLRDDFTSLSKQKKALKQAGRDLDTAKTRVRNSVASNPAHPRVESQRYELDEAEVKLDQAKDNYACDLFANVSYQRKIAGLTYLAMECKLDLLERSVITLNALLPSIKKLLMESHCGPVYRVDLHEHLTITERDIALPIEVCVKRLIEIGLKEEGLFRIAGSATKIKRLRCAFDAGHYSCHSLSSEGTEYDVHVVAGALKCYLRELPQPILTYARHDELTKASGISDHDERLRALWQVVNSLPERNLQNLRYIMKFLSMLAQNSAYNKMTANNIAIVMAPNLIWTESSELSTLGRNMTLTNDYRIVVEQMIEYCNYFFKDDIDFGVQPILIENDVENSGAVSQTVTAIKGYSHKRNNSSDLGVSGGHEESDVESPKQPHRNKKKPAPKPPSLNKNELKSAEGTPDFSPRSKRSKSPPVVLNPQGRPRYIRRPTGEPPLPPNQLGNRPPRPLPPSNYETVGEPKSSLVEDATSESSSNAVDVNNHEKTHAHEEAVDVSKEKEDACVSLRESAAASSEFRKSLEGYLRQPQALPRHLTRMSTSYPESGSESISSNIGFPVAAQRSFRKGQLDKVEPAAADKPVIAEKPNLQRPAIGAENTRPLIPQKPSTLSNKSQTKCANDDADEKNKTNSADGTRL